MDKRKAIPKILSAVLKKCQDELSALIGHQTSLVDPQVSEGTAAELFDALEKNQVLADLRVEGERPGTAFLTINLVDALMLGGTLIMLPENELVERMESGSFGEDEADAFGEIVNICAGVMTKLFTDLFPEEIRFVKDQQQIIDPLLAAAKGEYPVPEGGLWIARATLALDDKPLSGQFQLLIPAALLGMDEPAAVESAATAPEPATAAQDQPAVETDRPAADEPSTQETLSPPDTPAGPAQEPAVISEAAFRKLLQAINHKLGEEVGGFLGQELNLGAGTLGRLSCETFLEGKDDKQVLATMRVEGERHGTAYLLADLACGITLGGTLIMLPASELESRLERGEFGSEDADAFGEIVNIIAGIYTALFNDCYPQPLRFVKGELQLLEPLVAAAGGEFPLGPGDFYRNRVTVAMGGKSLGCIDIVIPLELLRIGFPDSEDSSPVAFSTARAAVASAAGSARTGELATAGERTIVIIAEDEAMADDYLTALAGLNIRGIYCQLQEGGKAALQQIGLRGAVLVMGEVKEQGIATAIQIRSLADQQVPLIAAGPNWTRSLVLQAIRYGVRDILVTPASSEQIREKIRANLAV